MYDRILVPTDGSPAANLAVDTAVDLAVTHDAAIHAIHVLQTERVAGMPLETTWVGVTEVVREEGNAALAGVREQAEDAGVPVETTILEGNPSREIVRAASEGDYDLLVMGTSGRVGLDRLLLGSVTERVVRRSPIPVLTVRYTDDTATEVASADANASG